MEKENSFAKDLQTKVCRLFLHCTFNTPEVIVKEVTKHLEASNDNVSLTFDMSINNDKGEEVSRLYSISIYDIKFGLRFDKKFKEPKEIEVPKVVKKPKKWWQIKAKEMVITEKQLVEDKTPYWVLNGISL